MLSPIHACPSQPHPIQEKEPYTILAGLELRQGRIKSQTMEGSSGFVYFLIASCSMPSTGLRPLFAGGRAGCGRHGNILLVSQKFCDLIWLRQSHTFWSGARETAGRGLIGSTRAWHLRKRANGNPFGL